VAELYRGPIEVDAGKAADQGVALHEKLQRAYWWIVNTGIISPFYDIEYNGTPPQRFSFGDAKVQLTLPTDQSYSSYVLLPLLSLATRRRCLLVGGPGRGKTAIAVLMGVLAGLQPQRAQAGIQHGQPQMTIADLLGNPLPSTLVNAKSMDEVQIAWRRWLGMRVKIIDEYNRIPTRTQSALLTVMADNYAELYDQVFECPPGAWYLTANDDAGGGTYQVIEALRDRIDVVVKALHFNSALPRRAAHCASRRALSLKRSCPARSSSPLKSSTRLEREIRQVKVPARCAGVWSSSPASSSSARGAAAARVHDQGHGEAGSGVELRSFADGRAGKDAAAGPRRADPQRRVGARLMTTLVFAKAHGLLPRRMEVEFEDVRQVLPFVLHDKLVQEPDAPFFEVPENAAYRTDRIGWLRRLFDLSCAEYDRLDRDREDPTAASCAGTGPRPRGGEREGDARAPHQDRASDRRADQGRQGLRPHLRRPPPAQIPAPALHELPSVFHAALEARRDYLNAVFRQDGRRVDPDAFLHHLGSVVGPLVDNLAVASAEQAEELTTALYRLSLRAHRQGLLGGDAPSRAIERAFASTLPLLLAVFPERARDLSLAVCNAALRLERLAAPRADRWLAAMESLGPSCADVDALFALGLVLAWREGAAEFRAAARERFQELSPVLRRATLGVEALAPDAERRFAAPLDAGALGAPEVVARVGGFVGFGGMFRDPPLVVAAEGRLFAFDSQATTEIFADAFGVTLRPVAETPNGQTDAAGSPVTLSEKGDVSMGDAVARLPLLAGASSHAYADGALAVTLPESHFVFVVGRRPLTP
jgi:MoxR-like ATPase